MNKIKQSSYDLIMSIGQNCGAPEILKESKLRRFAGPLDWLVIDYNSVMIIIKNKFQDFFNKEDLEFICYDELSN